MNKMKSEVLAAANFLVELLNGSHTKLSEEQLVRFKDNVCECLWNHYRDHWFPEKPLKGSGYRCIRINGKLDPLLIRAGALMGLVGASFRMLFPSELTIWVDPSEVCYRIGENGSICVLYGKPEPCGTPEPTTPIKSIQLPDTPPATPLSTSPAQKSFVTPTRISSSPSGPRNYQFVQQNSPPPSPVNRFELDSLAHQQLQMYLQQMGNNSGNCKDFYRNSALDSIRGLQRLFVSS